MAAGSSVLTIIALIVGVLGLLAGGFALVSRGSEGASAGMSARGRIVAALAARRGRIGAAGAASAHAYLVKTVPAASGVLDVPPPNVQLTYDEAVEPRFAIISVTDAAGQAGDDRAGQPLAGEPRHARRAAAAAAAARAGI